MYLNSLKKPSPTPGALGSQPAQPPMPYRVQDPFAGPSVGDVSSAPFTPEAAAGPGKFSNPQAYFGNRNVGGRYI
jgi:hypothetical protein